MIKIIKEMLSTTQKETALKEVPSFLEMAAFVYFPGSFLVGPQFSMKRYLMYVKGELRGPVCRFDLIPSLLLQYRYALFENNLPQSPQSLFPTCKNALLFYRKPRTNYHNA